MDSKIKFAATLPDILDKDDLNCIIPPVKNSNGQVVSGLYLGNLQSARNIEELKRLQIKAVLTTNSKQDLSYDPLIIPFHYCLNAIDRQFYDMSQHFEESIAFIEKHIKSVNVLVHCQQGCSRSASIVIAYLMKINQWKLEKSLKYVKERRPIIFPNPAFMQQLLQYEQKLSQEIENKKTNLQQITLLQKKEEVQREIFQNITSNMNPQNNIAYEKSETDLKSKSPSFLSAQTTQPMKTSFSSQYYSVLSPNTIISGQSQL